MNRKKTIIILFVIVVLALLIFFSVTPFIHEISRGDAPIFTVQGKTTIYDLDELPADNFYAKNNYPYRAYEIISFDNPIPERLDEIILPVTIYGKNYNLILSIEDTGYTELLEDGTWGSVKGIVDNYRGTIEGMEDSKVLITVGRNNSLMGIIQYPGEYIGISSSIGIYTPPNDQINGSVLSHVFSQKDQMTESLLYNIAATVCCMFVPQPTTYFTAEPVNEVEDGISPFVLTEEDFKKHPVFNDCLKDGVVMINIYAPNQMLKPLGTIDENEYYEITKNYGVYLFWNDTIYRIMRGPIR
ncbi:MAG: hypothetical protein Q4Q53_02015 [Methanocorpusculum sp.]|nr:hypothetical protein [Methanocorpusculum sp.]